MVKEMHIKNEKMLSALQKTASVLLFVAQIAFVLLFVSGVVAVKGVTVDLWGAIDLVLGTIENFKAFNGNTLYTGAFSIALGILYAVFLVLMIKRFFSSIKPLKKIFSNPEVGGKQGENAFLYLSECFGTTFFNILLFILLTRICFHFTLNNMAYITFLVGGGVYVVSRFCFYLSRNRNLVKSVLGFVTDLLLLVSVLLLLFLCSTRTIAEFFQPFAFLFQSFSAKTNGLLLSLFSHLVYPIFEVILYVFGLKLINNLFSYSDNRSTAHYYSEKIFKTALILLAVAFVVIGYEQGLSDFVGTLKALKPYVSIALLSTVCRLNFTFPEYHRLDQVYQPEEEKQEPVE